MQYIKLKVTIFIPFYTWNGDNDRIKITEKIFKHYNNIQLEYNNSIQFTFILVGSETKLSKGIAEKYFINSYYEFEQKSNEELLEKIGKTELNDISPKLNTQIFKVLSNKVQHGLTLARKTDFDVLLVAGSNDYIDSLFFHNLLQKYKTTIPQLYGISNTNNGNNVCCILPFSSDTDLIISDDTLVWHGYNNIPAHSEHTHSIYLGGIIGINRLLNDEYAEIVDNANGSESEFENECIQKIPNIMRIITDDLVLLNIKSNSGADLTHMSMVKYILSQHANSSTFCELSEKTKNNIRINIKKFNSL
jgi:hypothetical protein